MAEREPIDWTVYDNLDAGSGRRATPRSNRTCPNCGQEVFVVLRSLTLPNGAVWRQRQCRQCGHVEERVQPLEIPITKED